ncbi:MAG: hypothetical protein PHH82_04590, partial [Candidatus ainarchaeum sp.]|nr:hypothetical protein [Candidatus ainarchaeum sp.]
SRLAQTVDFYNATITGSSYYWNDSPETHLITTGQTYLVDAGVGKTLKYNSQTATETLGSGSNIKYKWASDANGTYATASFNASWLTAAELDAALLANNGSFDRYLYIKAQYNSTGAGANLVYSIDWEEYSTGNGTNVFGMGKNIFGKIINSRRIISAFKQLLAA